MGSVAGPIDNFGYQGHHLVEVSWGGQVAHVGEDPNVEVHGSAHCRRQSMRWQEPVMFSDPDDTRPLGAMGQ
jgi:hypothetical protein